MGQARTLISIPLVQVDLSKPRAKKGELYWGTPQTAWKDYVCKCLGVQAANKILVTRGKAKPTFGHITKRGWESGILVGRLWLKRNLTAEEFASYIAERMQA